MFVREKFDGESKQQAEEIFNEIRKAFKENLKNLSWMDEETKAMAEEKADLISGMFGFPDYILDPEKLDDKYDDLQIDQNQYFENNLKLNAYNLRKNLERLDQQVNKVSSYK